MFETDFKKKKFESTFHRVRPSSQLPVPNTTLASLGSSLGSHSLITD